MQMTVLTQEQVAEMNTRKPGRAPIDLSEYTEFLTKVEPGQYVEVSLSEGDKKNVVKRRMTTAARLMGLDTAFRNTKGDRVVFGVIVQGSQDGQKRTRKAKGTTATVKTGRVGRPRKADKVEALAAEPVSQAVIDAADEITL